MKKGGICSSRTINEEQLKGMVLQAINHMIHEKTDYLEHLQENITAVLEVRNLDSAESIDARMEQLQQEMMTRADNHESYGDIAEEIVRLREQKQQLKPKMVINCAMTLWKRILLCSITFNKSGFGEVVMKEKITLCGDNCIECPRYNAHSDEELKKTAELWYKIGWRNNIISNEEIKCSGCSSHKQCTYYLVECVKKHDVEKCNQCGEFPCQKITDMLLRSREYQKKCNEICTEQEYSALTKAFFEKEKNLRK